MQREQRVLKLGQRYWTDFATRGFPSELGTPFWPRFNDLTQTMESLVPPTPQVETDFATAHKCGFWTALEAA